MVSDDASSDSGILGRLRAAGIRPRRSLGQNFLSDPKLLGALVEASGVGSGDDVFEVGTGPGTLTRQLASRARSVLTVEVDPRLAAFARRDLRDLDNIELLELDALKDKSHLDPEMARRLSELGEFVWVSNLPYSVASPLIISFLEAGFSWRCAVLTLQLEVAERIVAPVGARGYGVLSLLVGYWAEARFLRKIGPGTFWPRPRVESAAVHLEPRDPPPDAEAYVAFKGWVRHLFGKRRKQLRTLLREKLEDGEVDSLLSERGWSPKLRPDALGIDDYRWLGTNFPGFSR